MICWFWHKWGPFMYFAKGWITEGDDYHYITGKWNGDVDSFKICCDCQRSRIEIEKEEIAEGCASDESSVPFGMLKEVQVEREREALK